MSSKEFLVVRDTEVKHTWACDLDTCDYGTDTVGPEEYENIGTPVCPECGGDMSYVCTSIDLDAIVNRYAATTHCILAEGGYVS